MKKSEMLQHIQDELSDTISRYNNASSAAKDHIVRSSAGGLLDMLEGFGMEPPATWFDHGDDDKELDRRWEKEE